MPPSVARAIPSAVPVAPPATVAGSASTLLGALALLGATAGTPALAQDGADCDATGATLVSARDAYELACPSIPRLDCDPIIGGWACASYRMGAYAPSGDQGGQGDQGGAVVAPSAAGTPGVGECRWIDATLETARAGYAAMCRPARQDCDPVPEGWMCSSRQIGASVSGLGADGGAVPDPVFVEVPGPTDPPDAPEPDDGADDGPDAPEPEVPAAPDDSDEPAPSGPDGPGPGLEPPPAPAEPAPAPAPTASVYDGRFGEPSVGWADSYSANGVCYASTTGDHGVYDLIVDTPTGRTTVREALRRIEQGPGIARADALYNDIRCGRGPANDAGDEDPGQCPGRVDQGRAGCGAVGPDWRFTG